MRGLLLLSLLALVGIGVFTWIFITSDTNIVIQKNPPNTVIARVASSSSAASNFPSLPDCGPESYETSLSFGKWSAYYQKLGRSMEDYHDLDPAIIERVILDLGLLSDENKLRLLADLPANFLKQIDTTIMGIYERRRPLVDSSTSKLLAKLNTVIIGDELLKDVVSL